MTELILLVATCLLGAFGIDFLRRKKAPPPPPEDIMESTKDGLDDIEADIVDTGDDNLFRRLLDKHGKR
jgi:hypothetical protein